VALEYAIVVPIVLAAMFLALQVAMYAYARSVAQTAAEDAVTAQRAYGAPAGAGVAAADRVLDGQGNTLSRASVLPSRNGGEIRFTVSGESLSVIPGFHLRVSQTASGPIERFRR